MLSLLTGSGSVCIHAKNLQKLMIEFCKSINYLSPSLVWEFHEKRCVEYNLRTEKPLQITYNKKYKLWAGIAVF